MQVGVMITNGGPHPPAKWAEQTASSIGDLIVVDEASASPEAIAARKAKPRFVLDVTDMLEVFHDNAQQFERSKLAAEGDARLLKPLTDDGVIDTIDEALAAVVKAAEGTPFAEHFKEDAVKDVVRRTIEQHFALSMDIERSYHADRNPDSETAKTYRALRTAHGPHNVHAHAGAHKPAA